MQLLVSISLDIHMILIYELHVLELRIEWNVYDPRIFNDLV